LWDVATGELIRIFDGYPVSVWSVSFSPDGTHVLIGASNGQSNGAQFPGLTQICEIGTGAVIRSFEGGFWCSFSPDGTRVLSGGGDHEIVGLWDALSGKLQQTLNGGPFFFAPDGKTILVGKGYGSSAGGTARLTDAATGNLLCVFAGIGRGDYAIAAFWPDGQHVLTSTDDVTAALWDIRDLLGRPRISAGMHGPEIHWDLGSLQFAPSTSGPWTDLPAASPFRLSPIGEKGFFRVKVNR
jgi:WD40 repeat protein